MRLRITMLLLFAAIAGCSWDDKVRRRSPWDWDDKVRKRASFDLQCSEEQLVLTELGQYPSGAVSTYGVRGCGKKASYVAHGAYGETPVLNSEIEKL